MALPANAAPSDLASIYDFVKQSIKAQEAPGGEIQGGVTIDLGHRSLDDLPHSLVEVFRSNIERLALAHNSLTSLPLNIAQCSRLRYLNIRYNHLRDFPEPILSLSSLEILDVSKNRIRSIPDGIVKLTSLKVFSVGRNRIERLPLSIADLPRLQVLKLEGNPWTYPPADVCRLDPEDPALQTRNDNERDTLVTLQVKKWLKLQARNVASTREKLRVDSDDESSEGNIETPKPLKRAMNGRFPVIPRLEQSDNNAEYGSGSPGAPPPIPSRSHNRVVSQNPSTMNRPGATPIITGNERNRSRSDTTMPPGLSRKRMGLIQNRDAATLDSSRLGRLTHSRGISQSSLFNGGSSINGGNSSSSPASPIESDRQFRNNVVRRLSSLPEYKRKSGSANIHIEAAKNGLYSMAQLHSMITGAMNVLKAEAHRRSSLDRCLTVARHHLEELDRCLNRYDTVAEDEDEDEPSHSTATVRAACSTALRSYSLVIGVLRQNLPALVRGADPRYIRGLLLTLYGCDVEAHNACLALGFEVHRNPETPRVSQARQQSVTPTQSAEFGGALGDMFRERRQWQPPADPKRTSQGKTSRPRAQTQLALPSVMLSQPPNTAARQSNRKTSVSSAISKTQKAVPASDRLPTVGEHPAEGNQFKFVLGKVFNACVRVLEFLDDAGFYSAYERDVHRVVTPFKQSDLARNLWHRSQMLKQEATKLMGLLTTTKDSRTQSEMWYTCHVLLNEFADFVEILRMIGKTSELRARMKNAWQAIKNVQDSLAKSPWSYVLDPNYFSTVKASTTQSPASTSSVTAPSGTNALSQTLPAAATSSAFTATPLPQAVRTVRPSASQFGLQSGPVPPASSGGFVGPPVIGKLTTGSLKDPDGSIYSSYLATMPATPLSAALGPAAQATVPTIPSTPKNAPTAGNPPQVGVHTDLNMRTTSFYPNKP